MIYHNWACLAWALIPIKLVPYHFLHVLNLFSHFFFFKVIHYKSLIVQIVQNFSPPITFHHCRCPNLEVRYNLVIFLCIASSWNTWSFNYWRSFVRVAIYVWTYRQMGGGISYNNLLHNLIHTLLEHLRFPLWKIFYAPHKLHLVIDKWLRIAPITINTYDNWHPCWEKILKQLEVEMNLNLKMMTIVCKILRYSWLMYLWYYGI